MQASLMKMRLSSVHSVVLVVETTSANKPNQHQRGQRHITHLFSEKDSIGQDTEVKTEDVVVNDPLFQTEAPECH